MEKISKYATGSLDPETINVWYTVELGFKPKMLSLYFYYYNSGTVKFSFSVNHCVYGGLDSRYVQITETGFKYLTTESSIAYGGRVDYAAAG